MSERKGNLPFEIETLLDQLDRNDLPEDQKAIRTRLKLDKRSRDVFDQLFKQRRPVGGFYYPTIVNLSNDTLSEHERQMSSIRMLFHLRNISC